MPIIEHPECKVEPGCNYTIYVETTDRNVQQIVKYELAGKYDFEIENANVTIDHKFHL